MTIGTGFFGRSSLTENLQPRDLVQWTQLAYTIDPSEPFRRLARLQPWYRRAAGTAAGAGVRGHAPS